MAQCDTLTTLFLEAMEREDGDNAAAFLAQMEAIGCPGIEPHQAAWREWASARYGPVVDAEDG